MTMEIVIYVCINVMQLRIGIVTIPETSPEMEFIALMRVYVQIFYW